ncbi:hypothetical protein D9M72_511700 [compost metagenome]
MHVRGEGRADGSDHCVTRGRINALQCQSHRPEAGEVALKRFCRQGAFHVDRFDIDIAPAALVEDRLHTLPVAKGKLPRRTRLPRRQVGQQRRGGALGGGHEGVVRRAAPCDATQHGTGLRGTPQVGKGGDRVGEEHHAKARHDGVETARREGMGLRVRLDEGGRHAFPLRARPRRVHQRAGDVDARALPARADPPRQLQRRRARTASDVEHMPRRAGIDCADEQRFQWLEHLV